MTEGEYVNSWMEASIQGIGGIDSTSATLSKGINVLAGRNATNRTSFLKAVMAALGGHNVSLKGDCDEGHVELTIDGEVYKRRLERKNGAVNFAGNPYLTDATEAELFAFLHETNEVRQAVATGADLRDSIMQPVETSKIDRQIRELQAERNEVDDSIKRLQQECNALPKLEGDKRQLDTELEDAQEALAAVEEKLEDTEIEQSSERKQQLEKILEELSELRGEKEDLRYRIETEREALTSIKDEYESTEAQLADLPDYSEEQLSDIQSRIADLRQRKRTFDSRVSKLHQIVQFNEEMLEEDSAIRTLFEKGNRDVTEELLEGKETTCWTCGSQVETDAITGMIDRLRELSQSQQRERNDIECKIDELTDRKAELEQTQTRRSELAETLKRLESDIDQRKSRLSELETKKDDLDQRIADLEVEAETVEESIESDVVELRQQVQEKRLSVERLEREREDIIERIDTLEQKTIEIEELEKQREQLTEQISELRNRIDRLEAESVEAFNKHISELIELLEYENIERVWVERKHCADRRDKTGTTFELHVVRTTTEGVTYEDSVDHLSESERELVGIVFALAGYLVYELYETVPVMLLDSLEAIDSERIACLVEYLSDFAPSIVVALLPEDAAALDDMYTRIDEI